MGKSTVFCVVASVVAVMLCMFGLGQRYLALAHLAAAMQECDQENEARSTLRQAAQRIGRRVFAPGDGLTQLVCTPDAARTMHHSVAGVWKEPIEARIVDLDNALSSAGIMALGLALGIFLMGLVPAGWQLAGRWAAHGRRAGEGSG